MGLLSRLNKIVKGARKLTADTFDAGWDVATAVWDDDEDVLGNIGNLFSTAAVFGGATSYGVLDRDVSDALKRHGRGALSGAGKAFDWTFGEPARGAMDLLNTAYREVIGEPVSTALTFGSLLDDPDFQKQLAGLSWWEKTKRTFSAADEVAEHRSPGQALWLAFDTESITDDDELAEAEQHPWFNLGTGMADAGLQIFADPTGIAVDAARGVRGLGQVRNLADLAANGVRSRSGEGLEMFVRKTIDERGVEEAPAIIRDRLFPSRTASKGQGDMVSSLLVDAATRRPREFDLVIRAFAGNADAFDELAQKAPHYADVAARAMEDASDYITVADNAVWTDPTGVVRSGRRLTEPGANTLGQVEYSLALDAAQRANEELTRIEGVRDLIGVWDKAPTLTRRGAIRTAYTRSQMYQHSSLFRPLRVLNGMNPRRALNVHSANLDVEIDRAMRQIGADDNSRNLYRSAMLDARTAGQRRAVIKQTHDFIINKVADDIGLTGQKRDKFLAEIAQMRADAHRAANSTFTDADGVQRLLLEDEFGMVNEAAGPALSTQMSNFEWLPDARRLEYLATKVKKGMSRATTAEITDNTLSLIYAVWKPATLLGFRTPIRVGTDEFARRVADMGLVAAGGDLAKQIGSKIGLATRAGTDWIDGVVYDYAPAFGETGDNIYRELVTETAKPGGLYGRTASGLYDDNFGVRDWRSIPATEAVQFDEAWTHAVNNQIVQSPLARRLLDNGLDRDEAVEWLRTGDGWQILRTADNTRRLDPEGWVDDVASQIEHVLPTAELQQAALDGTANVNDYINLFGGRDRTPSVHGQYLRDTISGKSSMLNVIQNVSDKLMTNLNSKPTVFLQRQPHFARKYAEEVLRLERMALDNGIELTEDLARTMENRARRYALEQTRDLLFDMAEQSTLADTFRFIAPFGNASREVITRWAGIVWRKPETVRRMQQIWSSPEKAGLIVDANGNEVIGDGKARTPDGEIVDAEGERFLRIQVPSGLPLPSVLKPASGSVRFSKDSFNTILANPWGVGPIASAAAGVLLKDRPDIQQSLKFMFPYGVPETVADAFTPTSLKRFTTGDGDHSYEAMKIYYFNSLYAQWAEDGRQLDDGQTVQQKANELWKQASETTRAVQSIRTVASIALPVQPQFTSPYQPYVDIYRRYQREDPNTAAIRFAEDFGQELNALTTSVTRSVNGIPPTIEGWKSYNEHKDLIDADPELGRIIVGEVGGKFNQAVYRAQLRSGQRVRRTKQEVIEAPDLAAGWNEYTKAMDEIDAIRLERGLPNLRVKAARDLSFAKQQITAAIEDKYPAWERAHSEIDPGRTDRRVAALRVLSNDEQLRDRDDMRGLRAYIALRDEIQDRLRQRQAQGRSGSLDARANGDLLNAWETERARVVARFVQFGPLFYRYFENDMLGAS